MGLNWLRRSRWLLIAPATYVMQGISLQPSGLASIQSLQEQETSRPPIIQHRSKPTTTPTLKIRANKLPHVLRQKLFRQAQQFTVKVVTPDNQGSGVIVQQQSGTYSVITNEHVVLDHHQITIYTHDGRTYQAKRPHHTNFGSKDLELLQFQSKYRDYPVATLRPGLHSSRGSAIFAAGFPHRSNGASFQATEGKVAHITPKSLNGGYRIGYSNWVSKGMSGGPVFNTQGQVIAINGIHAEPLWGNPYVWDDGTTPSPKLFPLLSRLSWAIPAETVIQSLPTTP